MSTHYSQDKKLSLKKLIHGTFFKKEYFKCVTILNLHKGARIEQVKCKESLAS